MLTQTLELVPAQVKTAAVQKTLFELSCLKALSSCYPFHYFTLHRPRSSSLPPEFLALGERSVRIIIYQGVHSI